MKLGSEVALTDDVDINALSSSGLAGSGLADCGLAGSVPAGSSPTSSGNAKSVLATSVISSDALTHVDAVVESRVLVLIPTRALLVGIAIGPRLGAIPRGMKVVGWARDPTKTGLVCCRQ